MIDDDVPPDASEPVRGGALSGIRVLELGTLIAGPFCGRLLADHGADVVKIEAPDRPDPLRVWGRPRRTGITSSGPSTLATKRCITLDLRRDQSHCGRGRVVDVAAMVECAVGHDLLLDNLYRAGGPSRPRGRNRSSTERS